MGPRVMRPRMVSVGKYVYSNRSMGGRSVLSIYINDWHSVISGSTQEATQRLQRAGKVAQDGFLRWNRTLHPVLLSYGLEQATLDNWSRNIDQGVSLLFLQSQ